jgi:hypothetical protein
LLEQLVRNSGQSTVAPRAVVDDLAEYDSLLQETATFLKKATSNITGAPVDVSVSAEKDEGMVEIVATIMWPTSDEVSLVAWNDALMREVANSLSPEHRARLVVVPAISNADSAV